MVLKIEWQESAYVKWRAEKGQIIFLILTLFAELLDGFEKFSLPFGPFLLCYMVLYRSQSFPQFLLVDVSHQESVEWQDCSSGPVSITKFQAGHTFSGIKQRLPIVCQRQSDESFERQCRIFYWLCRESDEKRKEIADFMNRLHLYCLFVSDVTFKFV